MAAKKNVPEIRFKGFEGDWENIKLTDIYNFQYGYFNNNPSDGGQYPVYGANGIIGKYSKYNAESSVVIGHMGEYAGSVIWAEGKHFVTYNGTISTVKNDRINSKYGFYLLSKLNINKICGGSGQPFLSYDTLEKIQSNISTSIPEQTQIGTYFQNLDSLITLHQRKYNKLLTVKKAMLEKMFPKEDADVPEIRFKGFEGKWEKKKLGEISDSYSGGTPSVANRDYYNGKIPFIRSGEINSNSTGLSLSEYGLKNSSAKIVDIGDILYALYGATSGEVGRAQLTGAINQAILSIRPHSNYDSEFIMHWLRKQKQNIICTYLQGGQGNLSGAIVKDLVLYVPTIEEQNKIGTFFQNLDTLITQHQKELEKLKNLKKACLEKMFV